MEEIVAPPPELVQQWCCMTCYAKFLFLELVSKPDCQYLHCPTCDGHMITPADGRVTVVEEYHGDTPPLEELH